MWLYSCVKRRRCAPFEKFTWNFQLLREFWCILAPSSATCWKFSLSFQFTFFFLSLPFDLLRKPLHKSEYPLKGFSLFIHFVTDFLLSLYIRFQKSQHLFLFSLFSFFHILCTHISTYSIFSIFSHLLENLSEINEIWQDLWRWIHSKDLQSFANKYSYNNHNSHMCRCVLWWPYFILGK